MDDKLNLQFPTDTQTKPTHVREWPAPLALVKSKGPRHYPVDALPGLIGAAVAEVHGFVQAPIELVATCAIAALSVAVQAKCDLERTSGLSGPTSLFTLILAESGERKTATEKHFVQAIRDYEFAQQSAAKPALRKYEADKAAWDSKLAATKKQISSAQRQGKPTSRYEEILHTLIDDEPQAPRVPHLLYSDITPEKLAFNLALRWPAAAILESEGGVVFGAHGMGPDSVVRNLALYNKIWECGDMHVDRRTSESFSVRGARITLALQTQESTLMRFINKAGDLARGMGFFSRFLFVQVRSTQGFRQFKQAPDWSSRDAFNQRISELLNQPVPLEEDGALSPQILRFTEDAQAAWIDFHDKIETRMRPGLALADVKDFASKAAENAARLSALFEVFENGVGPVGLDAFERAAKIVEWHLHESQRFFADIVIPPDLENAARLDTWLVEFCNREQTDRVPLSVIQRNGPCGIRSKAEIDEALRELVELKRVVVDRRGHAKSVLVNPALLAATAATKGPSNFNQAREVILV
jgi:putative DNA primase/helicase